MIKLSVLKKISLSATQVEVPPSEKSAGGFQQAGKKKGGWGEEIFARLPKRSPAALLVQSRTPKKSFVSLLEEKIGRAQNQKYEQNFSLVWRASASGGGVERVSFAQNRFGLCHIIAPD